MSMRATFTTDFIYDGQDGYLERKAKLCDVLDIKMDLQGGTMIGQLSGITSGLDLALEMCYDLSKIMIGPFRIVWSLEGGDLICKEIISLDTGGKKI